MAKRWSVMSSALVSLCGLAVLISCFETPTGRSARANAASNLVDLELVLAVDASGSVDAREYKLQMDGIAAAITDPTVVQAATSGPTGRVAVALVVWADATLAPQLSEWVLIDGPESAERFAALASGFPREVTGGTGIGAGVAAAMRWMDRNPWQALRQVVDVSGDGRETVVRDELAPLMIRARGMAGLRNVTINGLAILSDDDKLADYYRDEVITGIGSFVMTARGFEDFQRAMKRKLLREMALPTS